MPSPTQKQGSTRESFAAMEHPPPQASAPEELTPELRRILGDLGAPSRDVRDGAARALHQMGSALSLMVPALTGTLKARSSDIRSGAALALGACGANATAAVPALVEALGDEDRELSEAATGALVNIGSSAVPALAASLTDSRVNIEAMIALSKIGAPNAAAAVPALERALDNSEGPLKFMAAAALAQASGPEHDGWQKGAAALQEGIRGANALHAMGALRFVPTAAAVPALVEALAKVDEEFRIAAIESLECIGGDAVPSLIQALEGTAGSETRVFIGIMKALERIGRFTEEAVPMLMQKVLAGPTEQRCAALRVLGCVGEEARPAVPLLSHLAQDEEVEQEVRNCAMEAIRKIEG